MSPTVHFDRDEINRIWTEYASTHDLTGREREAVGIDPDTGEIHFGTSMEDIGERLRREGRFKPLYYRWVGTPYYTRKGGRR
jgi:hypothetical protein